VNRRNAIAGEVEELVELLARERLLLGRPLDLNESTAPVITTFMSVSARESSS